MRRYLLWCLCGGLATAAIVLQKSLDRSPLWSDRIEYLGGAMIPGILIAWAIAWFIRPKTP